MSCKKNCKFPKSVLNNKKLKNQLKLLCNERLTSCCFDLLDDSYLYTYIVYGQSNGTGVSFNGISNFNNIAIANNKKIEWNEGRTELRVVDNTTHTGYNDRLSELTNYGGFNPSVIGSNQLSSLLLSRENKSIQFISMNASWNGAALVQIPQGPRYCAKGSPSYLNMFLALNKAKEYAESIGKKLFVPFVIFVCGETDVIYQIANGRTSENYRTDSIECAEDFYQDVKILTGQSYFPKWYIVQESWDSNENSDMIIKQGQYSLDSKNIVSVYPTYQLSCLSGFGHYDTLSIFKWSTTTAKNIYKNSYLNRNYTFKVKSIKIKENTLTLSLNVPVKPIIFDTTRGISPNHGFEVTTIGNTTINILSVSILEGDKIVIECDQELTSGYVLYQRYKPYMHVPNVGNVRNIRPGSYVADSDTITSITGEILKNYLLAFKLAF